MKRLSHVRLVDDLRDYTFQNTLKNIYIEENYERGRALEAFICKVPPYCIFCKKDDVPLHSVCYRMECSRSHKCIHTSWFIKMVYTSVYSVNHCGCKHFTLHGDPSIGPAMFCFFCDYDLNVKRVKANKTIQRDMTSYHRSISDVIADKVERIINVFPVHPLWMRDFFQVRDLREHTASPKVAPKEVKATLPKKPEEPDVLQQLFLRPRREEDDQNRARPEATLALMSRIRGIDMT